MIVYDLGCAEGHRFEGWFASGDEFARQQDAGLVRCPICEKTEIVRLPSARVSVPKGVAPATENTATLPTGDAVAGIPGDTLAKLREIVRSTENVGRRFPEEARKIHYEEAPARAIRGQASAEEAEELRDEGIDFASLPPFFTSENH